MASLLALSLPWLLVPATLSARFALAAGSLAALILAAGFYRAGWWTGSHRLERVVWDREGNWLLIDAGGRTREVALAADTRLGPGCVWLRWQARPPCSLLLLPRDVPGDELRRLSVRLRIDRHPTPAIPGAAAI